MSDNAEKHLVAKSYPFKEIDSKWRKYWEDNNLHKTDFSNPDKKQYSLVMFSYPSGDKLHVGHWYNFAPADTWTRLKKMQGYNTFEPMGFDSFGLPAENYAIKTGIHPAITTKNNIAVIRDQLKEIGAMYDWDHELATSDPDYYQWTQWLFLKFFEHGKAVRKTAPVNWCPSCNTVLANEQVVDGKCERCDTEVTKKKLKQWFFKITDFADQLLDGLDKLDWPEKTKASQKNWIGRSEGTQIDFSEETTGEKIPVFTTRADTLFGVTYVVLAPEHPLVEKFTTPDNKNAVAEYIDESKKLTEIERLSTVKEKTGVFTGSYAINPINGEKIQIWIADYVLFSYGTGAVMAVPGHDERDWEFANKYDLTIKQVIESADNNQKVDLSKSAFTDYGVMINSGEFDSLDSKTGMKKITEQLILKNSGSFTINYKLRDWLISRQRYWGAPIPIIICPKCGDVPVPENDLPVLLPELDDFKPSGDGQSPLANSDEFVNTKCPKCGEDARRDTETMDTFVDSSWYFLRYVDPNYTDGPWNPEIVNKWLPVDMYIGGAEHTVMHLMYARFFCMFLNSIGLLDFNEPFLILRHQGIITSGGAKISKSRGNVVNPDKFVSQYGSDTFRIYIMFMGSYAHGGDWDDSGINGIARFLSRVYRLIDQNSMNISKIRDMKYEDIKDSNDSLQYRLNLTIKRVSYDIDRLEFNTAVAAMMELVNDLYKFGDDGKSDSDLFLYSCKQLILLLAPMAPHLAEELWSKVGGKNSVFTVQWPTHDPNALQLQTITMVAQVNGKLRGSFDVSPDITEEQFFDLVSADTKVAGYLEGKTIFKHIFVPKKLMNIVVK